MIEIWSDDEFKTGIVLNSEGHTLLAQWLLKEAIELPLDTDAITWAP